jgi:ADP-L-glycero-D-manno-heptose 6-epimerase
MTAQTPASKPAQAKRILVTGGAGFIGSNIAGYFADNTPYPVAVCDHFGSDDKWHNLANHAIFEIVNPNDLFYWLQDHAEKIEAIVHMGAISSTTETDVDLILDTNFALSKALWDWCGEHKIRFIYASSAATYGDGSAGFNDGHDLESLKKLRPMNPYGWSKQIFDQFVSMSVAKGNITPPQWAGLKFFNVYGPNEYHKGSQRSVAHQIFPHAMHDRPVHLFKSYNDQYGDGEQMRDFVYVKDCVDVVKWLVDTPNISGIFNVGTGKARSFVDLAKSVFTALGKEPRTNFVDMPDELQDKYQYFTQANMQKLVAAGYSKPLTSLEDGIADYVQNYLMKEDQYF